jgi:hypothetical protein
MVPEVNAGVNVSSESSLADSADSDYLRGVIFVGKGMYYRLLLPSAWFVDTTYTLLDHAVKAMNHTPNHSQLEVYDSYDDVPSRASYTAYNHNNPSNGRRFGTTSSEPIARPILSPINAPHFRIGESEHTPETPTTSMLGTPTSFHSPPSSNTSSSYFNTLPSSPRVHFRSRVRITSGLHRHHRKHHSQDTPSSSLSGSPSSSISAPLRTQADDNSPLWGPLGQRVSFLAWNKRKEVASHGHSPKKAGRRRRKGLLGGPNERTPLLGSRMYSAHVGSEADQDRHLFNENRHEAVSERLAHHVDTAFGVWPQRLLNPHVSFIRPDTTTNINDMRSGGGGT